MSKVKQEVTLKETRGGTKHVFSLDHALNLLRLQAKNNSNGWVIADEKYIFKNNEICKKPSSRADKKTEKRGGGK